MVEKARLTALVTALGITMTIALLSSPLARADENPFSVSNTDSSLVVAGDDGKCGDSDKSADDMSDDEGKCGDGGDDTKCGGQ